MHMDSIAPLRDFVIEMTNLVSKQLEEDAVLSEGSLLLSNLIRTSSWLPEFCATPHPVFYQQFLLHADPLERFSIVSFVWGPGQTSPIHDHCVWGLIGMLRGVEIGQKYKKLPDGKIAKDGNEQHLYPGEIEIISPNVGDIHLVRNALSDESSISIHVYGGNIGAVNRHVYDQESGGVKNFVSGYSSNQIPNLWDRSAVMRKEFALRKC